MFSVGTKDFSNRFFSFFFTFFNLFFRACFSFHAVSFSAWLRFAIDSILAIAVVFLRMAIRRFFPALFLGEGVVSPKDGDSGGLVGCVILMIFSRHGSSKPG